MLDPLPALAALLTGLAVFLLVIGLLAPPGRAGERPAAPRPSRLAELLRAAGWDASPTEFLLLATAAGGAGALLGWSWLPQPTPAALGAGLGLGGLWTWVRRRAERTVAARREAAIEAMQTTSQLVATGRTPRRAIAHLAERGDPALRGEFRRLQNDLALHDDVERAVRAMQARVADAVFDLYATALILNERHGSREFSAILARQAAQARRLQHVRRRAVAQYAQNQASALAVIGCLGAAAAAMLWLSPEALAFYATPHGQVWLVVCAGAMVLAYRLMMRIVQLPAERRVSRWTSTDS